MQLLRAPAEWHQALAGKPSSLQGQGQVERQRRKDSQRVLLWLGGPWRARTRRRRRRGDREAPSLASRPQRRGLALQGTCGMRGAAMLHTLCQARICAPCCRLRMAALLFLV